jgi:hypothetical protein
MNNVYNDKKMTEGEFINELNMRTKSLGLWVTPTPDDLIHDGFHLSRITEYDDASNRYRLRLRNSHISYTGTVLLSDVITQFILKSIGQSFIHAGFVKTFTKMVIDDSFHNHHESEKNRFIEMRRMLLNSINFESPEMFLTMINTDWYTLSMMYFVYDNGNIPTAELNWRIFEAYYELPENIIDVIINHEFDRLMSKTDEFNMIEIKAILLKWKKDHSTDNNGEEDMLL